MTTFLAWLRRYLASFGAAAKFYKAESFIANAVAVLFGILPDLINLVISQWSMVDALPALTPEHKLYLFGACNLAALLLRTRKQPNMPQGEAIPVATVNVPDVVSVGVGGGNTVPVQTEVRIVATGATTSQIPPFRLPESPAPAKVDADALYAQLVPSVPPPGARFMSFADFVDYGRANAGSLVNGMPWAFTFEGRAVTHENDDLYLIGTGLGDTLRFKRGDALMVGPGQRLQVLGGGAWSGLPA